MILTTCAACAAPLSHDAPRCVRCLTRYCSSTCQQDHWRRGHEQICERIHSGGNAEQHHADEKYREAVAVAVEACAEDTKGQTCYICYGGGDEGEGLVRMCACRGTAGFAHVSCLAEQAKILVAEAEENNLDAEAFNSRWDRWDICRLCEQHYHGVVRRALGWVCWKTYVGRPEPDWARRMAICVLGNGLYHDYHYADSLVVREAELSMLQRIGAAEDSILSAQTNIANSHNALGRFSQALELERDIYHGSLRLLGEENIDTLISANNYALSLIRQKRFTEAKSLMRKSIPVTRRVHGESDETTLRIRWCYAESLIETLSDESIPHNTRKFTCY